jgi:hypothetical protein
MSVAKRFAFIVAGLLLSSLAYATPAQEQACIARVSQLAGVPHPSISVASSSGGWFGLAATTIQVAYPNGTATCRVDRQNVVQDVQLFNSGGTPVAGGVQDLRNACSREAERFWNLPPRSVSTTDATANDTGMYEVTVVATGRQGRCVVTSRGAVIGVENR